ncbi:hypothetical protein AWB81_07472 [Caballeronia arationis]|nr:hypothetical protein AWB81_07472 [Caballeronia arationis]
MTMQAKFAKWRNVGLFCAQRASDYAELFSIELAETRSRMLHEVVALVALAIGALFTLSFVSIAIIVTAAKSAYVVHVAWGVAGAWLLVTLAAVFVMRSQRPPEPFKSLRAEVNRDLQAIKEASK